MKTMIYIACVVLLTSQVSCKHATETPTPDMYVIYQVESAFQGDSVRLIVDDKILMQSRVTTNYTVDLAWSSELQKLSRDSHTLHFDVIQYDVQNDYRINIANDTSSILIRFNRDTKLISIEQVKGILLRD